LIIGEGWILWFKLLFTIVIIGYPSSASTLFFMMAKLFILFFRFCWPINSSSSSCFSYCSFLLQNNVFHYERTNRSCVHDVLSHELHEYELKISFNLTFPCAVDIIHMLQGDISFNPNWFEGIWRPQAMVCEMATRIQFLLLSKACTCARIEKCFQFHASKSSTWNNMHLSLQSLQA
jgi:hypothetical protein